MSDTRAARPHRKIKSPKRNLGEIAFHLRNASYAFERLDRQNLTAVQRMAANGVGASLRAALAVVTQAQDTFA